ncbi:MAG: hypothetical protein WCI11_08515, partial [Candidatus Methylumidiphilus sp.]
MVAKLGRVIFCSFARSQAPAWERGLRSSCFFVPRKLELERLGFPSWSFKAINLRIFPFALSLSKGGRKNPNH